MDYLQTFFYFDNLASVSFFPILWMSLFVALFFFFLVWPTSEYALKRLHFRKEDFPHHTICNCNDCRTAKIVSFWIALLAAFIASSLFIDYFYSNSGVKKLTSSIRLITKVCLLNIKMR